MKNNRIKLCKEKGCRDEQTTEGYCRYHYMKNWKKLMLEKKKSQQKADNYVNVMAEQYSDDSIVTEEFSEYLADKNYIKSPLFELGLKEKDLKKDSSGDVFSNVDIDDLIENMKYDDNY